MIRVLDPIVAAQIAAGEVVERPASVIKELLENALDAGAQRITIDVRGGGIGEMRIQDDGSGIAADEVETAFMRHATSKLTSADDLWAIGTLGFRGEALPSIAAVSQVICTTRVADEPLGTELRIAGGELQARQAVGAAPGTTFVIRNLFYNVPVRREFLRAPATENAAISAIVTQYALAYPQVRFTLTIDGRLRLETNGSGHLPGVLLAIYGLETARQMLPVEVDSGGDLTRIAARGLVSPATFSRGSRDGMHISVNGRAVQPRGQIGKIFDEAYHTLLMKGRFPIVVLDIQLHPAAVDVNVHPTKSEVKFRDPERVQRIIARAIREVVQRTAVVQGWDGEIPQQVEADAPAADEPFEPLDDRTPEAWPDVTDAPAVPEKTNLPANVERPVRPPGASPYPAAEHATSAAPPLREAEAGYVRPVPPSLRSVRPVPREPHAAQAPLEEQAALRVDPPPVHTPVPGQIEQERREPLPQLRALAQLARSYLLAEGPEGALYLIDQHAAHERITYERLMTQHAARAIESQALLMPATMTLPPASQAALLGAEHELEHWGFRITEADSGVRVLALPASVAADQMRAALIEIADHLVGSGGSTPADWDERMLITLACHTSVRAGHPLTQGEQQALIDQLAACYGPRTCPHGRPTVIVVTRHQLARQFGRLQ
ncbi:MAG TPA: DNA mismatch repair endonuclease MutL [Roseiflexaceae bacterium]|nr:DNA mismatch repair endonuclease MutL [Roseiflexaceae bacterium]HMP40049.1 DNA mismatch repair endonuclease MutL [Roseiflexaceae bacterium]